MSISRNRNSVSVLLISVCEISYEGEIINVTFGVQSVVSDDVWKIYGPFKSKVWW